MKQVILDRTKRDDKQTTGFWECDEIQFSAHSLELGWHNNEHNISCIPSTDKVGKPYPCKMMWSNKHQRNVYHILGVPNRDAIELHSASFYKNLLGCISIGYKQMDIDHDGETDIYQSKQAVTDFETAMNGEDFELTIIENIPA